MEEKIFARWPAAPALNATIVLYATHPRLAGGSGALYRPPRLDVMQTCDIHVVDITWHRNNQASAANGVRVYALDDTGVWREADLKNDAGAATIGSAAAVAVPILASPAERRVTLRVGHLRGFAVEYTAGTAPTEWNGTIALHRRAMTTAR